jgi:hypothetical protein
MDTASAHEEMSAWLTAAENYHPGIRGELRYAVDLHFSLIGGVDSHQSDPIPIRKFLVGP